MPLVYIRINRVPRYIIYNYIILLLLPIQYSSQAVYFLHSTMPSVTCLRLSDVSVICRVTYFQFPIQSAILQCIDRHAAPALRRKLTIGFNTQYRTSDAEENLGRYLSCAKHTSQGKDFESILTVTRRTAVYRGTHCNIGSKRAFSTSVLDR